MDRCMNETIAFLNLFDIVATTATGIAAPVIGADDIRDGDTGADLQSRNCHQRRSGQLLSVCVIECFAPPIAEDFDLC